EWQVPVGDAHTNAVYEAAGDTAPVFVCAHGAGGHMADGAMLRLSAAMRARGISVVRFNFLYRAKGSSRPDQMPKLKDCFAAVMARTREEVAPPTLVIGGRSMGGRAGSMLAADGFDCDGLLLLAYPLHPTGRPEQLRDAHLPQIRVPVICFNGTRDPMCTPELMERALKTVTTRWEMHWLEGADHGFHVPKSSGRTDAQVLDEVAEASQEWIARLKE
ncbi:MAG TPA: alpha/beta family hydrolase, partial [Longimicrobiaceae bacterium]|nr:alpha/beta family hydrolase [Longimicrobiaceae bacterium]